MRDHREISKIDSLYARFRELLISRIWLALAHSANFTLFVVRIYAAFVLTSNRKFPLQ